MRRKERGERREAALDCFAKLGDPLLIFATWLCIKPDTERDLRVRSVVIPRNVTGKYHLIRGCRWVTAWTERAICVRLVAEAGEWRNPVKQVEVKYE
jgi:hypothetical protein